jgi:hypothetical protein
MNKDFNKFIKRIAKLEYPGDPATDPEGRFDVDGLRSRYTAVLRQRIACGLVRGNHKTYAARREGSWPAAAQQAELLTPTYFLPPRTSERTVP